VVIEPDSMQVNAAATAARRAEIRAGTVDA